MIELGIIVALIVYIVWLKGGHDYVDDVPPGEGW
jgi:hypothetical protein